MLQVPPVTTHRVALNGPNVVVSAQLGAGETLQNDAESSRRDVKASLLDPYTLVVRNPEAVVLHVNIGNEVFAAPSIRIEAVGETVEGSDWHICLSCESMIAFPSSGLTLVVRCGGPMSLSL